MSKRRNLAAYTSPQASPNPAFTRPGEGVNVPVIVSNVASLDGTSMQYGAIGLNEAPVPERKYVASVCGLIFVPGTLQLLFGQRRIGSDELRSLLAIQMSALAATRFMSSLNQLAPNSLDEVAKQNAIKIEPSPVIASEPAQTVEMAAGFVLLAVTGDETTLDFYQASAFAMAAMPMSKKLALDPVVRIDLRTSLFLGLVEELKKISSQLPKGFSPEST